jgi:nucleotide-binding universal stress UspA family protein
MYKHILIPTDGSDLSGKAVREGIALAKELNARVTALTVTPSFQMFTLDPVMVGNPPEQYRKDCEAAAARYLGVATESAKVMGVTCEGVHLVSDHPYQAIIETAQGRGCDLIFMASHGRGGVAALVLGSETTKVLTHSRIPVLVCR